MPKQMAKRYFKQNEDRIKSYIERKYDQNPDDGCTFDEFCEEFPADAGWDKPNLDWFMEEYLYNFVEQHHINDLRQEMELLFDAMLNEFLGVIAEQEAERWEYEREYREIAI